MVNRRLQLAIGCLACATSAVSAAPGDVENFPVGIVAGSDRIAGSASDAFAVVPAKQTDWLFPQPPTQQSMKTYLVYQKTGRPLRVEAETIGIVRDGVVVLHNQEGLPIAVIPVGETAGIIEERAVLASDDAVPKAKAKAAGKSESA